MSNTQYPPYTITPAILHLVAEISEALGRLSAQDMSGILSLRRINRIRTIQGSLAIEGNALNEEQVTAILDGKRVLAPAREIQEVKNAITVYNRFPSWAPKNQQDLLDAHRMLMIHLLDDAGEYRNSGVVVLHGDHVIHMAPPADRVSLLMDDLFAWLSDSDQHPLITSSVFHYEFEFIHPFSDGNGRMGRLWQSLILGKWNPLFEDIPVESLVNEHQTEYYQALQESTQAADSAPFIQFMLSMIRNALLVSTPQVAPQVAPQVGRLLLVLQNEMTRAEIQDALQLRDRKSFRELYLTPALSQGLVEMTIPDKPNSRLQKYRLTSKGRQWGQRPNITN